VAIISLLLVSCSEDSTEPTKTFDVKYLHSEYIKLWKLTEITVNGGKIVDDSKMDEMIIFDKLGGGIIVYGEYDSSISDTLTSDHFKYEFVNGNTIKCTNLHLNHSSDGNSDFNVINLTDDVLVFEQKITKNNKTTTTRYSYIRAVTANPNADGQNLALTKGNVKLWKVAIQIIDGVEQVNPCYRDDLFLFATDGTGIKIFGDNHCKTADTTNNDFFSWKIIQNGSKIVRANMHPTWNHQTGEVISIADTINIISLTNDEFQYTVLNSFNGVKKLVDLTNVPYIR
jgi:hypothetical protein